MIFQNLAKGVDFGINNFQTKLATSFEGEDKKDNLVTGLKKHKTGVRINVNNNNNNMGQNKDVLMGLEDEFSNDTSYSDPGDKADPKTCMW